jgi:hypothetical protein
VDTARPFRCTPCRHARGVQDGGFVLTTPAPPAAAPDPHRVRPPGRAPGRTPVRGPVGGPVRGPVPGPTGRRRARPARPAGRAQHRRARRGEGVQHRAAVADRGDQARVAQRARVAAGRGGGGTGGEGEFTRRRAVRGGVQDGRPGPAEERGEPLLRGTAGTGGTGACRWWTGYQRTGGSSGSARLTGASAAEYDGTSVRPRPSSRRSRSTPAGQRTSSTGARRRIAGARPVSIPSEPPCGSSRTRAARSRNAPGTDLAGT